MFAHKGLFRHYSSTLLFIFKISDLLVLIGAGLLTHSIFFQKFPYDGLYKALIVFSVFVFSISAMRMHLYVPWRESSIRKELAVLSFVHVMVAAGLISLTFILGYGSYRTSGQILMWVIIWVAISLLTQALSRTILRITLRTVRRLSMNQRKLLLVGGNANAKAVIQRILDHPDYGLQIIGYVDDRAKPRNVSLENCAYLGSTAEMEKIISEKSIDQVWITYPLRGEDRAKSVLNVLRFSTISIRYVLDLKAFKDNEKTLTHFVGIPLLDIDVSPMDGTVSRFLKNVEDQIVAWVVLLLLSPLMLIIALGVKVSSPGPILYRQIRIGWNNCPFEMLKFRSMPINVEIESGPKWASPGDNRATKLGAFLRKTSLDELPQFINVIRGEMSIIGPRPERPEFVEEFKSIIPDYMKKHMVKAGITGWAQINGYRGNTDLKKRIEHDLYYIRNWSPLFDLQIAFLTILKGFVNKNAY
jgi:putative colanic acid biosynthesis UDP-glucose lipid carrier transferase